MLPSINQRDVDVEFRCQPLCRANLTRRRVRKFATHFLCIDEEMWRRDLFLRVSRDAFSQVIY